MNFSKNNINISSLHPKHIAIIMDGNGRWAKNKNKSRIEGHKAGVKALLNAVNFALKNNLQVLTLYAFSTENWNRSKNEVNGLMKLFTTVLKNETKNLHNNNIKLCIIGNILKLKKELQNIIKISEKLTSKNNGLILNIAINYGGRWDIIQGIKKIALKVKKGLIDPNKITEHTLSNVISIKENIPLDFVIRTGGEYRISNFLLWQIAYSELFFTKVLWPDFDDNLFKIALDVFAKRNRRFGLINN